MLISLARPRLRQALSNARKLLHQNTNVPSEIPRELTRTRPWRKLNSPRAHTYRREMFISAPDQVMVADDRIIPKVFPLTCDSTGPNVSKPLPPPKRIAQTGQLDNVWTARVSLRARGPRRQQRRLLVRFRQRAVGERAEKSRYSSPAATDYQGFAGRQLQNRPPRRGRFGPRCQKNRTACSKCTYGLRQTSARLAPNPACRHSKYQPAIPTNQTGRRTAATKPRALYFNFGRYLLISSSRPGGFPANFRHLGRKFTPWTAIGTWTSTCR